MTIRIAMWSGPRNISTTMMRSFGARANCAVSDEPFYGCFLKDTGADHPMADAVIEHRVLSDKLGVMDAWVDKGVPIALRLYDEALRKVE